MLALIVGRKPGLLNVLFEPLSWLMQTLQNGYVANKIQRLLGRLRVSPSHLFRSIKNAPR